MQKYDKFTLVVAKPDPEKKDIPNLQRTIMLKTMKPILMAGARGLNNDEKNEFYAERLRERCITRDGRDHYEFNLTITNYAERHLLARRGNTKADINHFLNPQTGLGINVSLEGFITLKPPLIKLLHNN